MTEPFLLPCPFCGGTKLTYREDLSEDDPTHCYAFHIFCRDCHCHGRNHYRIGWCENVEMAREAWNDRPDVQDVTEAMALAGARSIGNTIHTDNHLERARECWRAIRAMWAARDGIMEPVPRERRP